MVKCHHIWISSLRKSQYLQLYKAGELSYIFKHKGNKINLQTSSVITRDGKGALAVQLLVSGSEGVDTDGLSSTGRE